VRYGLAALEPPLDGVLPAAACHGQRPESRTRSRSCRIVRAVRARGVFSAQRGVRAPPARRPAPSLAPLKFVPVVHRERGGGDRLRVRKIPERHAAHCTVPSLWPGLNPKNGTPGHRYPRSPDPPICTSVTTEKLRPKQFHVVDVGRTARYLDHLARQVRNRDCTGLPLGQSREVPPRFRHREGTGCIGTTVHAGDTVTLVESFAVMARSCPAPIPFVMRAVIPR